MSAAAARSGLPARMPMEPSRTMASHQSASETSLRTTARRESAPESIMRTRDAHWRRRG